MSVELLGAPPEPAGLGAEGSSAEDRTRARVEAWPELGELRQAQAARGRARLAAAVGQLTCTARVSFGEALLEFQGGGQGPLCDRAAVVHSRCLSLLREGLADLVVAWRWTNREAQELSRQLQALVGSGCGRGGSEVSEAVVKRSGPGPGRPERLGSERCLFFMGLANGWPWESALRDLGDLGPGVLDQDGKTFTPVGTLSGRRGGTPDGDIGCWKLGSEGQLDSYLVTVGAGG